MNYNYIHIDESNLYCKWLNCKVPKNKWFCVSRPYTGDKTCSHCNWSKNIITAEQKQLISSGYAIEVVTRDKEKIVIQK